ncbi:MAG: hypothetical protein ACW99H_11290 [Candidatus Thorarchaeota archaeon]
MVDKLDYKIVGLAIIFLLCWMGYSPIACRSTVVWSDDFNDGNYDGWTICANELLYGGDYGFNGSQWSAANNYLQLDHEELGIITHPSDVAYGTWSFDFNANESHIGSAAGINIISTDEVLWTDTDGWDDPERTGIWIFFEVYVEKDLWSLRKLYDGEVTTIDYEVLEHVVGWHHIDVTRNTTGWFSVYHNGSPIPIMEGQDTDITTSELFWLWFEDWQMIDNIVVDDEVLEIGGTGDQIDWLLIGIIGASAVVIIVVLAIVLRRR